MAKAKSNKLSTDKVMNSDARIEANETNFPARNHHQTPCLLCGKAVNDHESVFVELGDGGSNIIVPGLQDEDGGSIGCFPIGPQCIRKIPKRFHVLTLGKHEPNCYANAEERHAESVRQSEERQSRI